MSAELLTVVSRLVDDYRQVNYTVAKKEKNLERRTSNLHKNTTKIQTKKCKSKRGEGSQLRSIPGDDGYGTGIIPGGEETPVDPEEPDIENENPYRICFKRNNYYILHGDYAKLTTMMYVLQVTVNPNWDGDVYLPLDKSDNGN